jgi:hypothetical protein
MDEAEINCSTASLPHFGQVFSGGSENFTMRSKRLAQAVHLYSYKGMVPSD